MSDQPTHTEQWMLSFDITKPSQKSVREVEKAANSVGANLTKLQRHFAASEKLAKSLTSLNKAVNEQISELDTAVSKKAKAAISALSDQIDGIADSLEARLTERLRGIESTFFGIGGEMKAGAAQAAATGKKGKAAAQQQTIKIEAGSMFVKMDEMINRFTAAANHLYQVAQAIPKEIEVSFPQHVPTAGGRPGSDLPKMPEGITTMQHLKDFLSLHSNQSVYARQYLNQLHNWNVSKVPEATQFKSLMDWIKAHPPTAGPVGGGKTVAEVRVIKTHDIPPPQSGYTPPRQTASDSTSSTPPRTSRRQAQEAVSTVLSTSHDIARLEPSLGKSLFASMSQNEANKSIDLLTSMLKETLAIARKKFESIVFETTSHQAIRAAGEVDSRPGNPQITMRLAGNTKNPSQVVWAGVHEQYHVRNRATGAKYETAQTMSNGKRSWSPAMAAANEFAIDLATYGTTGSALSSDQRMELLIDQLKLGKKSGARDILKSMLTTRRDQLLKLKKTMKEAELGSVVDLLGMLSRMNHENTSAKTEDLEKFGLANSIEAIKQLKKLEQGLRNAILGKATGLANLYDEWAAEQKKGSFDPRLNPSAANFSHGTWHTVASEVSRLTGIDYSNPRYDSTASGKSTQGEAQVPSFSGRLPATTSQKIQLKQKQNQIIYSTGAMPGIITRTGGAMMTRQETTDVEVGKRNSAIIEARLQAQQRNQPEGFIPGLKVRQEVLLQAIDSIYVKIPERLRKYADEIRAKLNNIRTGSFAEIMDALQASDDINIVDLTDNAHATRTQRGGALKELVDRISPSFINSGINPNNQVRTARFNATVGRAAKFISGNVSAEELYNYLNPMSESKKAGSTSITANEKEAAKQIQVESMDAGDDDSISTEALHVHAKGPSPDQAAIISDQGFTAKNFTKVERKIANKVLGKLDRLLKSGQPVTHLRSDLLKAQESMSEDAYHFMTTKLFKEREEAIDSHKGLNQVATIDDGHVGKFRFGSKIDDILMAMMTGDVLPRYQNRAGIPLLAPPQGSKRTTAARATVQTIGVELHDSLARLRKKLDALERSGTTLTPSQTTTKELADLTATMSKSDFIRWTENYNKYSRGLDPLKTRPFSTNAMLQHVQMSSVGGTAASLMLSAKNRPEHLQRILDSIGLTEQINPVTAYRSHRRTIDEDYAKDAGPLAEERFGALKDYRSNLQRMQYLAGRHTADADRKRLATYGVNGKEVMSFLVENAEELFGSAKHQAVGFNTGSEAEILTKASMVAHRIAQREGYTNENGISGRIEQLFPQIAKMFKVPDIQRLLSSQAKLYALIKNAHVTATLLNGQNALGSFPMGLQTILPIEQERQTLLPPSAMGKKAKKAAAAATEEGEKKRALSQEDADALARIFRGIDSSGRGERVRPEDIQDDTVRQIYASMRSDPTLLKKLISYDEDKGKYKSISAEDFKSAGLSSTLSRLLKQYRRQRHQLPPRDRSEWNEDVRQAVMNQLLLGNLETQVPDSDQRVAGQLWGDLNKNNASGLGFVRRQQNLESLMYHSQNFTNLKEGHQTLEQFFDPENKERSFYESSPYIRQMMTQMALAKYNKRMSRDEVAKRWRDNGWRMERTIAPELLKDSGFARTVSKIDIPADLEQALAGGRAGYAKKAQIDVSGVKDEAAQNIMGIFSGGLTENATSDMLKQWLQGEIQAYTIKNSDRIGTEAPLSQEMAERVFKEISQHYNEQTKHIEASQEPADMTRKKVLNSRVQKSDFVGQFLKKNWDSLVQKFTGVDSSKLSAGVSRDDYLQELQRLGKDYSTTIQQVQADITAYDSELVGLTQKKKTAGSREESEKILKEISNVQTRSTKARQRLEQLRHLLSSADTAFATMKYAPHVGNVVDETTHGNVKPYVDEMKKVYDSFGFMQFVVSEAAKQRNDLLDIEQGVPIDLFPNDVNNSLTRVKGMYGIKPQKKIALPEVSFVVQKMRDLLHEITTQRQKADKSGKKGKDYHNLETELRRILVAYYEYAQGYTPKQIAPSKEERGMYLRSFSDASVYPEHTPTPDELELMSGRINENARFIEPNQMVDQPSPELEAARKALAAQRHIANTPEEILARKRLEHDTDSSWRNKQLMTRLLLAQMGYAEEGGATAKTKQFKLSIGSGGQTGADQGALEAAIAAGQQVWGTAPYGYMAEDAEGKKHKKDQIPQYMRDAGLQAMPETTGRIGADYARRTEKNIRDADATLVFHRGKFDTQEKIDKNKGTYITLDMARKKYASKPLLDIDLDDYKSLEHVVDTIVKWQRETGIENMRLNVAGSSESSSKGMQAAVKEIISRVLARTNEIVTLPPIAPTKQKDNRSFRFADNTFMPSGELPEAKELIRAIENLVKRYDRRDPELMSQFGINVQQQAHVRPGDKAIPYYQGQRGVDVKNPELDAAIAGLRSLLAQLTTSSHTSELKNTAISNYEDIRGQSFGWTHNFKTRMAGKGLFGYEHALQEILTGKTLEHVEKRSNVDDRNSGVERRPYGSFGFLSGTGKELTTEQQAMALAAVVEQTGLKKGSAVSRDKLAANEFAIYNNRLVFGDYQKLDENKFKDVIAEWTGEQSDKRKKHPLAKIMGMRNNSIEFRTVLAFLHNILEMHAGRVGNADHDKAIKEARENPVSQYTPSRQEEMMKMLRGNEEMTAGVIIGNDNPLTEAAVERLKLDILDRISKGFNIKRLLLSKGKGANEQGMKRAYGVIAESFQSDPRVKDLVKVWRQQTVELQYDKKNNQTIDSKTREVRSYTAAELKAMADTEKEKGEKNNADSKIKVPDYEAIADQSQFLYHLTAPEVASVSTTNPNATEAPKVQQYQAGARKFIEQAKRNGGLHNLITISPAGGLSENPWISMLDDKAHELKLQQAGQLNDKRISSFRGSNAFLSNFFKSPIEYEGAVYPSVENAFQAAKTLDLSARVPFQNPDMNPGAAKTAGKKLELRKDWEDVKVGIMRSLIEKKFAPGSNLAKMLTDTGVGELVEGNNWGDQFWGATSKGGENVLGKLLMERRGILNPRSLEPQTQIAATSSVQPGASANLPTHNLDPNLAADLQHADDMAASGIEIPRLSAQEAAAARVNAQAEQQPIHNMPTSIGPEAHGMDSTTILNNLVAAIRAGGGNVGGGGGGGSGGSGSGGENPFQPFSEWCNKATVELKNLHSALKKLIAILPNGTSIPAAGAGEKERQQMLRVGTDGSTISAEKAAQTVSDAQEHNAEAADQAKQDAVAKDVADLKNANAKAKNANNREIKAKERDVIAQEEKARLQEERLRLEERLSDEGKAQIAQIEMMKAQLANFKKQARLAVDQSMTPAGRAEKSVSDALERESVLSSEENVQKQIAIAVSRAQRRGIVSSAVQAATPEPDYDEQVQSFKDDAERRRTRIRAGLDAQTPESMDADAELYIRQRMVQLQKQAAIKQFANDNPKYAEALQTGGIDYDKTLMHSHKRFVEGTEKNLPLLLKHFKDFGQQLFSANAADRMEGQWGIDTLSSMKLTGFQYPLQRQTLDEHGNPKTIAKHGPMAFGLNTPVVTPLTTKQFVNESNLDYATRMLFIADTLTLSTERRLKFEEKISELLAREGIQYKSLEEDVVNIQKALPSSNVRRVAVGLAEHIETTRQSVMEEQKKSQLLYGTEVQPLRAMTMGSTKDFGKSIRELESINNKAFMAENSISRLVKGVSNRVLLYGGLSFALYGVVYKIQQSIALMADFERQVVEVTKVMNPLFVNTERITDAARDMGSKYGISITEAAKAMAVFAQQGKTTSAVIALSNASLLAANTTTFSAAEATEALTAALRQFNIADSQVINVLDSWNEVENRTAITSQTLADAVKHAGISAKTAGITFHELNGLTAAVGSATRQTGNEIGRSFRFMFSNLKTDEAIKGIQNLGVAVYNSEGGYRDAFEILGDIAGKWDDLNSVQKQAIAIAIAGTRRYNDLLVIFERWPDVLKAVKYSLTGYGSSEKENILVTNTFEKQIAKVKAGTQGLVTQYGEAGGMAILENIIGQFDKIQKLASMVPKELRGLGATLAMGIGGGTIAYQAFDMYGIGNFLSGRTAEAYSRKATKSVMKDYRKQAFGDQSMITAPTAAHTAFLNSFDPERKGDLEGYVKRVTDSITEQYRISKGLPKNYQLTNEEMAMMTVRANEAVEAVRLYSLAIEKAGTGVGGLANRVQTFVMNNRGAFLVAGLAMSTFAQTQKDANSETGRNLTGDTIQAVSQIAIMYSLIGVKTQEWAKNSEKMAPIIENVAAKMSKSSEGAAALATNIKGKIGAIVALMTVGVLAAGELVGLASHFRVTEESIKRQRALEIERLKALDEALSIYTAIKNISSSTKPMQAVDLEALKEAEDTLQRLAPELRKFGTKPMTSAFNAEFAKEKIGSDEDRQRMMDDMYSRMAVTRLETRGTGLSRLTGKSLFEQNWRDMQKLRDQQDVLAYRSKDVWQQYMAALDRGDEKKATKLARKYEELRTEAQNAADAEEKISKSTEELLKPTRDIISRLGLGQYERMRGMPGGLEVGSEQSVGEEFLPAFEKIRKQMGNDKEFSKQMARDWMSGIFGGIDVTAPNKGEKLLEEYGKAFVILENKSVKSAKGMRRIVVQEFQAIDDKTGKVVNRARDVLSFDVPVDYTRASAREKAFDELRKQRAELQDMKPEDIFYHVSEFGGTMLDIPLGSLKKFHTVAKRTLESVIDNFRAYKETLEAPIAIGKINMSDSRYLPEAQRQTEVLVEEFAKANRLVGKLPDNFSDVISQLRDGTGQAQTFGHALQSLFELTKKKNLSLADTFVGSIYLEAFSAKYAEKMKGLGHQYVSALARSAGKTSPTAETERQRSEAEGELPTDQIANKINELFELAQMGITVQQVLGGINIEVSKLGESKSLTDVGDKLEEAIAHALLLLQTAPASQFRAIGKELANAAKDEVARLQEGIQKLSNEAQAAYTNAIAGGWDKAGFAIQEYDEKIKNTAKSYSEWSASTISHINEIIQAARQSNVVFADAIVKEREKRGRTANDKMSLLHGRPEYELVDNEARSLARMNADMAESDKTIERLTDAISANNEHIRDHEKSISAAKDAHERFNKAIGDNLPSVMKFMDSLKQTSELKALKADAIVGKDTYADAYKRIDAIKQAIMSLDGLKLNQKLGPDDEGKYVTKRAELMRELRDEGYKLATADADSVRSQQRMNAELKVAKLMRSDALAAQRAMADNRIQLLKEAAVKAEQFIDKYRSQLAPNLVSGVEGSIRNLGDQIRNIQNATDPSFRKNWILASSQEKAAYDWIQAMHASGKSMEEIFSDPAMKEMAKRSGLVAEALDKALKDEESKKFMEAATQLGIGADKFDAGVTSFGSFVNQLNKVVAAVGTGASGEELSRILSPLLLNTEANGTGLYGGGFVMDNSIIPALPKHSAGTAAMYKTTNGRIPLPRSVGTLAVLHGQERVLSAREVDTLQSAGIPGFAKGSSSSPIDPAEYARRMDNLEKLERLMQELEGGRGLDEAEDDIRAMTKEYGLAVKGKSISVLADELKQFHASGRADPAFMATGTNIGINLGKATIDRTKLQELVDSGMPMKEAKEAARVTSEQNVIDEDLAKIAADIKAKDAARQTTTVTESTSSPITPPVSKPVPSVAKQKVAQTKPLGTVGDAFAKAEAEKQAKEAAELKARRQESAKKGQATKAANKAAKLAEQQAAQKTNELAQQQAQAKFEADQKSATNKSLVDVLKARAEQQKQLRATEAQIETTVNVQQPVPVEKIPGTKYSRPYWQSKYARKVADRNSAYLPEVDIEIPEPVRLEPRNRVEEIINEVEDARVANAARRAEAKRNAADVADLDQKVREYHNSKKLGSLSDIPELDVAGERAAQREREIQNAAERRERLYERAKTRRIAAAEARSNEALDLIQKQIAQGTYAEGDWMQRSAEDAYGIRRSSTYGQEMPTEAVREAALRASAMGNSTSATGTAQTTNVQPSLPGMENLAPTAQSTVGAAPVPPASAGRRFLTNAQTRINSYGKYAPGALSAAYLANDIRNMYYYLPGLGAGSKEFSGLRREYAGNEEMQSILTGRQIQGTSAAIAGLGYTTAGISTLSSRMKGAGSAGMVIGLLGSAVQAYGAYKGEHGDVTDKSIAAAKSLVGSTIQASLSNPTAALKLASMAAGKITPAVVQGLAARTATSGAGMMVGKAAGTLLKGAGVTGGASIITGLAGAGLEALGGANKQINKINNGADLMTNYGEGLQSASGAVGTLGIVPAWRLLKAAGHGTKAWLTGKEGPVDPDSFLGQKRAWDKINEQTGGASPWYASSKILAAVGQDTQLKQAQAGLERLQNMDVQNTFLDLYSRTPFTGIEQDDVQKFQKFRDAMKVIAGQIGLRSIPNDLNGAEIDKFIRIVQPKESISAMMSRAFGTKGGSLVTPFLNNDAAVELRQRGLGEFNLQLKKATSLLNTTRSRERDEGIAPVYAMLQQMLVMGQDAALEAIISNIAGSKKDIPPFSALFTRVGEDGKAISQTITEADVMKIVSPLNINTDSEFLHQIESGVYAKMLKKKDIAEAKWKESSSAISGIKVTSMEDIDTFGRVNEEAIRSFISDLNKKIASGDVASVVDFLGDARMNSKAIFEYMSRKYPNFIENAQKKAVDVQRRAIGANINRRIAQLQAAKKKARGTKSEDALTVQLNQWTAYRDQLAGEEKDAASKQQMSALDTAIYAQSMMGKRKDKPAETKRQRYDRFLSQYSMSIEEQYVNKQAEIAEIEKNKDKIIAAERAKIYGPDGQVSPEWKDELNKPENMSLSIDDIIYRKLMSQKLAELTPLQTSFTNLQTALSEQKAGKNEKINVYYRQIEASENAVAEQQKSRRSELQKRNAEIQAKTLSDIADKKAQIEKTKNEEHLALVQDIMENSDVEDPMVADKMAYLQENGFTDAFVKKSYGDSLGLTTVQQFAEYQLQKEAENAKKQAKSFRNGSRGRIPGTRDQAQLAILHGQERVLSASEVDTLTRAGVPGFREGSATQKINVASFASSYEDQFSMVADEFAMAVEEFKNTVSSIPSGGDSQQAIGGAILHEGSVEVNIGSDVVALLQELKALIVEARNSRDTLKVGQVVRSRTQA